MEGIRNPEELRERFEVSDPPAEQPQRAGIIGLKIDLKITREINKWPLYKPKVKCRVERT